MEFKRGKNKIVKPLGIREMYKLYAKISKHKVSYKRFAAILKCGNKIIVDLVVNHSDCFELPYRLGKMRVVKYERGFNKPKNKWAVDWVKTKELGFKVYHDSEYIYKFEWIKSRAKFINKTGYSFKANRKASRMVPKAIKNKVDYFKR